MLTIFKRLFWATAFLLLMNSAHAERADLSWVQSWGYWLQEPDIEQIVQSPYDLLVIDYSFDGTDDTAFTTEEIQRIKDAGKVILAYFSIGEAETYRFYWQNSWGEGNPGFVGPENPEWEGNYKVQYWDRQWWKQVLKPYMKKITAAGFNGVYLDIVDAYYYWGEEVGTNLKWHANRMAKLTTKIANFGRKKSGEDFIVCPQNALGIIDDTSSKWRTNYLSTIDCVGVESLYYNTYSEEDKAYRIDKANEYSQAGKAILNVEYIAPDQYGEYYSIWESAGMNVVGYPAEPDAALDELVIAYP